MDITIQPGEDVTIRLAGATAIRIDPEHRVIAVDGTSTADSGPLAPEWLVLDLRDGTYGDFHRLTPADGCFDRDCARSGQHAAPADLAAFRDALGNG